MCSRMALSNEPFVAKRGDTSNIAMNAGMTKKLSVAQLGCISSHLYMLEKAAEIDEEWFFVCEDDADIEGWSSVWHFTWKDIIREMPVDANECRLYSAKERRGAHMQQIQGRRYA